MKKLFAMFLGLVLVVPGVPAQAAESGLNADVWIYGFNGVPERSTSLYPVCTTNGVITEVQTLEALFGAPFQEVIVAGCQGNYVLVNLTGFITLSPGTYTFNFSADDGLYLKIGDQVLTSDPVDWIIKPPGGSQGVQLAVTQPYSLPVDYWFFDNQFGSYADVEILNSQGVEISQADLFTKTPKVVPVAAPPYEGPLNLRVSQKQSACKQTWQITGERLGTIKEITLGGQPVKITSSSASQIVFEAPENVAAGKQKLNMWVPVNSVNLFEEITVSSSPTCSNDLLRLNQLASGARTITSGHLQQLKQFLSTQAPAELVCVGVASSSEGRTARTIALARAQSACLAAQGFMPGLKTTILTSIRQGNSPDFRGVTLKPVTNR